MFEWDKIKGTSYYFVQLAEDTTNAPFDHYLVQQTDSANATLISNLQFGKKYQWRYAGVKNGKVSPWNGPYHFEIMAYPLYNGNLLNFTVTHNDTAANAGGLIINDRTHAIVDRAGRLVWYLDKVDWHVVLKKKDLELTPRILDLRLTPFGTVTYLADSLATECDLQGNILWKAPNDGKVAGGQVESYNHDFKRLSNGHYLVLGNELLRKLPPYSDTVHVRQKYPDRKIIDGAEYGSVEFGTVIEYDKSKKVVWSWNSQNYLDSDALKPKAGVAQDDFELKAHINAVSTDASNKYIYVGFRNISRIVKVEKKTGKVVDSWGLQLSSGEASKQVLLHQQHDANILDDGTLAVYNNNNYPGSDSISRVVIFSTRPEDDGRIIWSFDCNFDSLDKRTDRNGGNVDQLKNGNLLVCMGNMDHIFEVTRDKKVVWECVIKANGKTGNIYFRRLYRAHYISSLYPCYFAFKANVDTVTQKEPGFSVKIFNKGSENDSYQVKISAASWNLTRSFITSTVEANHSATIDIKPDRPLVAGDKIRVTVNSKTNPDLERKEEITVVK